ncbi:hypothetical protein N9242_03225 [Vicingaceae bacterium]|nr:hypothetical protein [Vicingaceae bacterium]
MAVIVEVCIASVEDAIVAERGGADRVELNAALQLGGLTPSIGLLREVKSAISIPVITMLRPRAGNFSYAESEFQVMLRDADLLLENGANGLAFGFLNDGCGVDTKRTRAICRRVGAAEAVFHRAFDFTHDMTGATDQLIDCGIKRLMTSGGKQTAMKGIDQIRKIVDFAAGRIEVLPASGIGPDNALAIIQKTACNQLHGSFSIPSEVTNVNLSGELSLADPKIENCSKTDINTLIKLIKSLNRS